MKRLLVAALGLALCMPVAYARKPTPKGGTVDKKTHIYTDAKYDYQMTLSESWKYKSRKNKERYRFVLMQKNYQIPSDYANMEAYTQEPKLVVWVDTTTLGAFAFLDSLLSDTYKSDQKKDILKEFDIINESAVGSGTYREALVPKGRRTLTVDGVNGFRWKGRVAYMKEIAESLSAAGGKRVRGAYGGLIAGLKKGNVIMVFHVICEWDFFDGVEAEVMEMIKSVKWSKDEKADEGEKK